jgi:hypothetical protein
MLVHLPLRPNFFAIKLTQIITRSSSFIYVDKEAPSHTNIIEILNNETKQSENGQHPWMSQKRSRNQARTYLLESQAWKVLRAIDYFNKKITHRCQKLTTLLFRSIVLVLFLEIYSTRLHHFVEIMWNFESMIPHFT